MSTVNPLFYNILSTVWNDNLLDREEMFEIIKHWALMATFYEDTVLYEELKFLLEVLKYKE